MSVVKSKRTESKLEVMTKANVDECYMSWKAHAKQGNTHNLILSMDKFYKNLWKEGSANV